MINTKNLMSLAVVWLVFISNAMTQHNVTIVFEGITNPKGDLYVGLYNQPEGFMAKDKTYLHTILPITDTEVVWEIKDLADGDYAVVTFQDANENGKCDFSFLGFPLERFGFSLEPKIKFRAPYFEETSFKVDGDKKVKVYVKSLPEHLFQHSED